MEFNTGYGLLLHEKDIKIHRKYFAEMTNLIGIKCIFYAPRPGKHWTTYGEKGGQPWKTLPRLTNGTWKK